MVGVAWLPSLSLSLSPSFLWVGRSAHLPCGVSVSKLFTPLNRRSRDQRRFHSRMLFMCLRLGLITFASRKSCGIVFVFLLFLLWHHFCQESSKMKRQETCWPVQYFSNCLLNRQTFDCLLINLIGCFQSLAA